MDLRCNLCTICRNYKSAEDITFGKSCSAYVYDLIKYVTMVDRDNYDFTGNCVCIYCLRVVQSPYFYDPRSASTVEELLMHKPPGSFLIVRKYGMCGQIEFRILYGEISTTNIFAAINENCRSGLMSKDYLVITDFAHMLCKIPNCQPVRQRITSLQDTCRQTILQNLEIAPKAAFDLSSVDDSISQLDIPKCLKSYLSPNPYRHRK